MPACGDRGAAYLNKSPRQGKGHGMDRR